MKVVNKLLNPDATDTIIVESEASGYRNVRISISDVNGNSLSTVVNGTDLIKAVINAMND